MLQRDIQTYVCLPAESLLSNDKNTRADIHICDCPQTSTNSVVVCSARWCHDT